MGSLFSRDIASIFGVILLIFSFVCPLSEWYWRKNTKSVIFTLNASICIWWLASSLVKLLTVYPMISGVGFVFFSFTITGDILMCSTGTRTILLCSNSIGTILLDRSTIHQTTSKHNKTWPMYVLYCVICYHYVDVIMSAMASQITSLTIVNSTVYSGGDQIRHQSSASLAFVRGSHRGPVNSPHNSQYAENVSTWWRHHEVCVGWMVKSYQSWLWQLR